LGKYCGLGLAGFPNKVPDVAVLVVSLLTLFCFVADSRARLPLSPHFNPQQEPPQQTV